MIIQPKDGYYDLSITSRLQTWIVCLPTEIDDECAILTSAPEHTCSACLCVFQIFAEMRVPEIRQSPSAISVVCKSGSSFIDTVADGTFHVKIINGILDRVFDGHWTCILVNQLVWQCIHPIGPQYGRYFMAESLVI